VIRATPLRERREDNRGYCEARRNGRSSGLVCQVPDRADESRHDVIVLKAASFHEWQSRPHATAFLEVIV
jgi:hypothetical protein